MSEPVKHKHRIGFKGLRWKGYETHVHGGGASKHIHNGKAKEKYIGPKQPKGAR